MPTLLHRRLFLETTQNFLLCVVSLLSLLLIGRGLQLRDLFLGLDFTFADIALLFLYMMPLFLIMVLPISCMVAVFLTFLRMGSDREIIALKAGGVGLYQMLAAPMIFSALCMVACFGVSLEGIPWGMGAFRSTVLEIASTRAKVTVQAGVFNKDIIPGLTLFARKVDPETGKLRQVVFEDNTRKEGVGVTILAPEGEILTDEQRGELVFFLKNGRIYRADAHQVNILGFQEYEVRVNLSEAFKDMDLGDVRPKEMSMHELYRLTDVKSHTEQRLELKAAAELQKRWALPVACVVLGVFAVPLACAFEGARRQMGVALSLGMFLVYYSLFSIGMNTGESGVLPPVIGLWAANVIFVVLAAAGIILVARERTPNLPSLVAGTSARLKKLLRSAS